MRRKRRDPKHSPFKAACHVHSATFSIGAESGSRTVSIQLQDVDFADLASRGAVHFYLSSDANGDALASAPDGGIAAGTDGLVIETLADQAGILVSEADGDIDLVITESGAPDFYLVLVMPDGRLVVSSIIAFAA